MHEGGYQQRAQDEGVDEDGDGGSNSAMIRSPPKTKAMNTQIMMVVAVMMMMVRPVDAYSDGDRRAVVAGVYPGTDTSGYAYHPTHDVG